MLRKDEKAVKEILEKEFGWCIREGADPPDLITEIDGDEYYIEVSSLAEKIDENKTRTDFQSYYGKTKSELERKYNNLLESFSIILSVCGPIEGLNKKIFLRDFGNFISSDDTERYIIPKKHFQYGYSYIKAKKIFNDKEEKGIGLLFLPTNKKGPILTIDGNILAQVNQRVREKEEKYKKFKNKKAILVLYNREGNPFIDVKVVSEIKGCITSIYFQKIILLSGKGTYALK